MYILYIHGLSDICAWYTLPTSFTIDHLLWWSQSGCLSQSWLGSYLELNVKSRMGNVLKQKINKSENSFSGCCSKKTKTWTKRKKQNHIIMKLDKPSSHGVSRRRLPVLVCCWKNISLSTVGFRKWSWRLEVHMFDVLILNVVHVSCGVLNLFWIGRLDEMFTY